MLKDSVPFIMLDDKSAAPIYRQIYEAVRQAILSGEFLPTMPLAHIKNDIDSVM
ncbi:MAG: hypothetical protein M3388_09790 [Acidobacteriota bacterium]|nr:hypothetical protein [Acidobacteriota bacterium]